MASSRSLGSEVHDALRLALAALDRTRLDQLDVHAHRERRGDGARDAALQRAYVSAPSVVDGAVPGDPELAEVRAEVVPVDQIVPVEVYVPESLGPTLEAIRPAIERLARARPLGRAASVESVRGGVEGGLSVIVGEIEAVVRPEARNEAQDERDRARLDRELADAQGLLASARARLANEAFTSKAPLAVVEGARARAAELEELVTRLTDRLK